MRRLRILIYLGLACAWIAFALWQYRNLGQQQELIQESLRQQSHSIMTAMVGGMRSHRRLGRFFEDQLRGMLDELVKSGDVVYVAIRDGDGRTLLSNGDAALSSSSTSSSSATGTAADRKAYFHISETFELSPQPAGSYGGGGGGGGGRGLGKGGGSGAGRGRGLGVRRWEEEDVRDEGPFGSGGTFTAEMVLDRRRANELERRARSSHLLAVFTAGLVALSFGLVWRATMNLAETKGHARVIEAESRHLRDLSQAAAGLAHETRNPLGLIRGWTQRLADTEMPELDRQEQSQLILEECDRVTARINQFLAFARPCKPDIGKVNVQELLDELAMILQPDLEAHQLQLQCQVFSEVAHLLADFELLRQVIFNLLQNAVHFSPAEATVEVAVIPEGGSEAKLQVADRGPGVEPASIESLFTPYFTTRPNGTGLGLAIVRHIATLHGWHVAYRPRAGGGAIFEIGRMHVAD